MIEARAVERVVAWHIDRVVRRMRDLEDLVDLCERTGVRLATVSGDLDLSTDAGQLVARILGAVAQGETKRKGARQRRANAQRAERGEMGWTRRPFGYDRDAGAVVAVPAEVDALRGAARTVLDGGTLAAAVRDLDARGLTTTAGGPWNVTTLRRALLNPRYAGRVLYRGVDRGEGVWPVVIDGGTQDRLAEALRDPARRVQQGTQLKYLLSGYARCGRCGERLYATTAGTGGRRWIAYRCRVCYLARRQDQVDELVEAVVLARLARPDAAALLAGDRDTAALRARAGDLRRRRDELAALLADGMLTAPAVRKQSARLSDELDQVEARLAGASSTDAVTAVVGAEDVAGAWGGLTLRQRRQVVELLVTVTILEAGRGARFTPETVAIEWKGAP